MLEYYQEQLSNDLSYFKRLLDISQDVFWVTNSDYSVQIYVSPAFKEVWGYESSVLFKNPLFWLDTLHIEDKLRLASIGRLPHSSCQNYYQERYRILRANGEVRWIQDHTRPILNKLGKCVGYSGIALDITHTVSLEGEFHTANVFLPKLAEKMERSAFWVRDPTLEKQLYLSKGFEEIWGRTREYLYAHPDKWLETVLEEDRERDKGSMLSSLDQKGQRAKYYDIYRIKRPDGGLRWIRDVSFPIYEKGECIGFAGIAEDVTQEKLYEIELKAAKEKAEAANIAKSSFIASMSHDFRTPLNGLLGMAEILRAGRCYPEQKEYIEALLQSGNSLLDLVEDIINFVSLDLNRLPIQNELFSLDKLIEEIMLTMSPQAHKKNVEIILSFSEQAPKEVCGDAGRVRRILMNLVNNAVKFTDEGHVLISVELQKQTERKLWLRFMVEDTGIGISKENFEFIFGSFNRVDPSYRGRYKGTGLGLTIVKHFVSDLGGKLKLKSQLGQGSNFYCSIPFKKTTQKRIPKNDHYTHLKMLVVDDFKKRATTFIKQFGLNWAEAATGKNVLDLIQAACNDQKPYELIILDEDLNVNLIELAKSIRKIKATCLILLANKNSNQSMSKLKKIGFTDIITKPLQPLVVIKILENAVVDLALQSKKKKNIFAKTRNKSVLLVEDDLLTQKITLWMLEEFGCKTVIAATGEQALEMIEVDQLYDLILTDIGLPGMDGLELVAKVRSLPNYKTIPIVALTAHVLEKDKEKCIAAGMSHFLKKPLFKKDLKKLLLTLFEKDD
jgi:PAS domain S-box-containing protein